MSLEQIQNVIIASFVAFGGTLVGGLIIRLALRKLYDLLTGQLNAAVLENKISAETKDKAVALLNETQGKIENKIDVLIQNTEVKDARVLKLLDFYQDREERIIQFMSEYFPEFTEELTDIEE